MKAILVIEMPSNCVECPLCDYEYNECKGKTDIKPKVWVSDERQPWCPLKPIPHKLQADWYTDGYKEGFNACLEEIEK